MLVESLIVKSESTFGVLSTTVLLMLLQAFLLQVIWNRVLYEKIEGVDTLAYWDALAIIVLVELFRTPLYHYS